MSWRVVPRAEHGGSGHPLTPVSVASVAAEQQPAYSMGLPDLQHRLILEAYERARGNKAEAARILGMPKSTFADRIRRILAGQARRAVGPPDG